MIGSSPSLPAHLRYNDDEDAMEQLEDDIVEEEVKPARPARRRTLSDLPAHVRTRSREIVRRLSTTSFERDIPTSNESSMEQPPRTEVEVVGLAVKPVKKGKRTLRSIFKSSPALRQRVTVSEPPPTPLPSPALVAHFESTLPKTKSWFGIRRKTSPVVSREATPSSPVPMARSEHAWYEDSLPPTPPLQQAHRRRTSSLSSSSTIVIASPLYDSRGGSSYVGDDELDSLASPPRLGLAVVNRDSWLSVTESEVSSESEAVASPERPRVPLQSPRLSVGLGLLGDDGWNELLTRRWADNEAPPVPPLPSFLASPSLSDAATPQLSPSLFPPSLYTSTSSSGPSTPSLGASSDDEDAEGPVTPLFPLATLPCHVEIVKGKLTFPSPPGGIELEAFEALDLTVSTFDRSESMNTVESALARPS